MTEAPHHSRPMRPEEPERIDPTFRNGSLTAVGVVTAFSLGFLSNWALAPGTWNGVDIVAVTLISIGIGMQIWSLAGMLQLSSLVTAIYNRLTRAFLIGVQVTALGVVMAIVGDVTGIGQLLPVKFFW